MDFGAFELQIFVSLIVVLGAAFVALVCDYLKGNNEQLREHNIELRVRKDEQERRGILDPARWLDQLVSITQSKAQSVASSGGVRHRTTPVEAHEVMNSWASKQDLDRVAQRGASMSARRAREQKASFEEWVSPETMARVAAKMGRQSGSEVLGAEQHAAAAESQGDIRDEIQKLVETSPRSRRSRGDHSSVKKAEREAPAVAVAEPVAEREEEEQIKPEPLTAVAKIEQPPALTAEPEVVAAPRMELSKELERVSQSRQRVAQSNPGVTQFTPVQVAPLKLEEELQRVAEVESAAPPLVEPVSSIGLLDEVIAASSHHSRFETARFESEAFHTPAFPVQPEPEVVASSRPLLASPGEIPSIADATLAGESDHVEVVVPVQSVDVFAEPGLQAVENHVENHVEEHPVATLTGQPSETVEPVTAEAVVVEAPAAEVEPEPVPVVEPAPAAEPVAEIEVIELPAVTESAIEEPAFHAEAAAEPLVVVPEPEPVAVEPVVTVEQAVAEAPVPVVVEEPATVDVEVAEHPLVSALAATEDAHVIELPPAEAFEEPQFHDVPTVVASTYPVSAYRTINYPTDEELSFDTEPVATEPVVAKAPEPELTFKELPEEFLPSSMETAFSWPPARAFHTPKVTPATIQLPAIAETLAPPAPAIEEPNNLTCFEEPAASMIPQVPEPAMFQAMIESISLLPVEEVDLDAPHDIQGVPMFASQTATVVPMKPSLDSNDPLPEYSGDEHPALLLPTGMHDRLTFSRLLEAPGSLSGVVVSISLNDYQKIQDSLTHQAFDDLMRSIGKMMSSMIRDQDFGVRLGDSEWVFVYRNEIGAVAQKRILQISEKLWDFQLRSMGSISILFGWGAVEVENERLSEAYNSSVERMEQSRRGRKTVSMDSRDKRRVVNG